MGFFSAIGDFVSGAVSAVSNAFKNIGGVLGTLASTVGRILPQIAPFIGPIVQAIQAVALILDILKPDDDIEELGAKAMMADKKPEDFDSTEKYIDYLRNDVKIDKEKLKDADETTKLARKFVGSSITSKAIEEKLDSSVSMNFWKEVAKQDLKAKEIISTIESYKKNNLNISDYSKYMKGDMDISAKKEHSNAISEAYKELEPSITKEQIDEKIMKLKESSNE